MTDLITITEYKNFEGVSGFTDDSKLNLIIPAVNELVRRYCGKTFNQHTTALTAKVELFSTRYPMDVIFPTETPLISITSLEIDNGSGFEIVDPSLYGIDNKIDTVRLKRGKFPVGVEVVRLTYRAGYTTIPGDLKLALVDLINYYKNNEHIPEKNHASFTIRHEDGKAAFPDHIRRVLDLYKDG